ncbi:MAG: spore coat associated protein CotJA [Clostridia bacterium]|nr:spore coat associated protein CotJA [Clostridia bacterium]
MQKTNVNRTDCCPGGGSADTAVFPYTSCSPLPLAMAYAPMQEWEGLYDAEAALMRGTLFTALDKPFIGEEAVPR